MVGEKELKRIFKLSMAFVMVATIYFVIGRSVTLVNSISTFSFLVTLVCISWALFIGIKNSMYIRIFLLISGFIYIYTGDVKDMMVLSYLVLVFMVLGLIHAFVEIVFLKKSKQITRRLKILFKQVSNYNTVIVISFIMVFLNDFVFQKIYGNFYMDYFEILITIIIYCLIMGFSMLRIKNRNLDFQLNKDK